MVDLLPADVILLEGTGGPRNYYEADVIRFMQHRRGEPASRVTHCAVARTVGTVIEAVAGGVQERPLEQCVDGYARYYVYRMTDSDRERYATISVVRAVACLGRPYAWWNWLHYGLDCSVEKMRNVEFTFFRDHQLPWGMVCNEVVTLNPLLVNCHEPDDIETACKRDWTLVHDSR